MRVLLLFPLLLPAFLFAQERAAVFHTPRTNYLFPEEADPAYILRADVIVRDGPSKDANVAGSLSAGDKVTIEKAGTSEIMIDGITSYWYFIISEDLKGWVWGGHIAQHTSGSYADPNIKFIGGIDGVSYSDTSGTIFNYRLVAVREGNEVGRIVVRSFAHGFDEVVNRGNLGLKAVDDVFFLRVPCIGGCGCSTGQVVVFWSSGRFHHVEDLIGSPDGEYSSNRALIFPADIEGLPGTVIKWTTDYEEADEHSIQRIVSRDYLRWDGQALVYGGIPSDIRNYEITLE